MPRLLAGTPEACAWIDEAIARHGGGIYDVLKSAVIWSDARRPDGKLQVEVDPEVLVSRIAQDPIPLLHGHDPGKPVGYLIEAERFFSSDGVQFVAGLVGFYDRSKALTFEQLGIVEAPELAVRELPEPPADLWIELLTDPRHVEPAWVDEVAALAPLRVERRPLSHNSAEATIELVRVAVVYAALVWNPLVKSFATEAGKAAYAGLHSWLKYVVRRLAERRAPVLSIESHQNGCHVHFLIRGSDTNLNFAAHEGLPQAAAKAAVLLSNLRARGLVPVKLVYEFDAMAGRWTPSFAVLADRRIITSKPELIACASELPKGLSLGLAVERDEEGA